MVKKDVYFYAIIAAIAVIIINQVFIQYWLHTKRKDAVIINIGGKQRMLSQRLMVLSLIEESGEGNSVRQEIKAVQAEWSSAHDFLIKELSNQYFVLPEMKRIVSRLEKLLPAIERGIQLSTLSGKLSKADLNQFLTNQNEFLVEMNAIVNVFEKHSSWKLSMVVAIEIIFALISLGLICYEIFFVFRVKNKQLSLQNEALTTSNKLLEQYAYLAAHDLRSPIINIIAFVKLLKDKLYEQIGEKEKRYFDYALQAAENSRDTTSDLLALSTINSQQINYSLFDPQTMINSVLKDMELNIQESKAEVSLVNDLPTSIYGDKKMLHTVFQNLIENGIKFVPEATSAKVNIKYHHQAGMHIFEFEDNGIGIDPSDHEKIFGLFKRLHNQRVYKGTGIGLAVCQKIMEKHEGYIQVESEIDSGATFRVFLPN